MGSSGSGRFGDYNIRSSLGGTSNEKTEIECPLIVETIKVEDVATSQYYLDNQDVPLTCSRVELKSTIVNGRLVIEHLDSRKIVGNLPTQFNYLYTCIKQGMNYKGEVVSSGISPVPYVVVTLHA